MVDVSQKAITERQAVAQAIVRLGEQLFILLKEEGSTSKGPVFQTAIIAGIQGAKKTSEIIPMCHPLPLSGVEIETELIDGLAVLTATVRTTGQTGVEMEALTAASVAALTLYDMCKSVTKGMVIESVRLLKKTGGKSGVYSAATLRKIPNSPGHEDHTPQNSDPQNSTPLV
jgi:cyclic pyranopterin phosphate synthase